jgi:hypothetical protein
MSGGRHRLRVSDPVSDPCFRASGSARTVVSAFWARSDRRSAFWIRSDGRVYLRIRFSGRARRIWLRCRAENALEHNQNAELHPKPGYNTGLRPEIALSERTPLHAVSICDNACD